MPQLGQIHIDTALTSLSIAYLNPSYIAEVVFPAIPVDKRSDKWFVYGKEHLKVYEARRAPRSVAQEVDFSLSTSNYSAEERALRQLVTDAEAKLADSPIQLKADAVEFLTDRLKLTLENDVATKLTDTSQVTQNTALAGTTQWSDYTNSVPLTNIATAKKTIRPQIIRPANTFVVPYEVAMVLADHPSIKDLIKYTDPQAIMESGLPANVRGLKVVEAEAVQNTANEGQAATLATIWGKNAIVMYVNPRPTGLRTITTAAIFDAPDDTTGARGFAARQYRDDPRKGDVVELSRMYDLQFIAANGAYLFTTAIA